MTEESKRTTVRSGYNIVYSHQVRKMSVHYKVNYLSDVKQLRK